MWRSEYCDVEGNRYPVLFGLQDAMASRMKCSDKTVYRLIQEGKLPAVRIGGRALRILETAFNNYLKNQAMDPDEQIMADR